MYLYVDTQEEEEEKEKGSNTKRAISRIRARLISMDRLSRDSYGSSMPPSDDDRDYGESFDRDDVDDNYLIREDNQHADVEEEDENVVVYDGSGNIDALEGPENTCEAADIVNTGAMTDNENMDAPTQENVQNGNIVATEDIDTEFNQNDACSEQEDGGVDNAAFDKSTED